MLQPSDLIRHIFMAPKILPLAELIKVQEGILSYKVNNGQYLISNFLTDGHLDSHYQLRNDADLRIPLHICNYACPAVYPLPVN